MSATRQRSKRVRPEEIAFYISGQLLTEDYYAVNKLAKGFLGTNNVDSNSRLCMSSAVAGYTGALGSDGPPPSYADIDEAECLFLVGSNAAACHPIVWNRMRSKGAFLIVADPRRTPTAEHADLHLPVRPGTDLPLLNAMLHVIERDGLLDRTFLERHTRGAEDTLTVAADWPPERAAEVCGVPAEDIVAAARRFGQTKRAMALWSMGVNQSTVGTLKNRAILNLCLATGNIGRPGSGPLSLTGQPNAMGGRETGGLAGLLPGYRSVTDPEHRAELRRFWDSPGIAPEPGIAATELVEALEERRVKVVWIVATNPVVSQPDARPLRRRAAPRRPRRSARTPTSRPRPPRSRTCMLPAAQWPEKDGTMTNSERRVSLVQRALDPPGEALPDWEIFARVGRALGHREAFAWRTAAQVHAEYVRITEGRLCDQTGISHARLKSDGPLQWPCPSPEHPGHRAPLRRAALRHARRPRAARPDAAHPAGRPRRRRLPARAHHRPGRAAVAHDDPDGQVELAAGRRAAAVPGAAPRDAERAGVTRRRARPGPLAARHGGAARAAHRDRARGRRMVPDMKPTIRDVAEAAGLGTATVERVLNGRGGVRPDTAEKVLVAARRLDVQRKLPQLHRGLLRIEVILVRPEATFFSRLSRSFERIAASLDPIISVHRTFVDEADPKSIADRILNPHARRSGLIIAVPSTQRSGLR